jgi:hypothetical protein
MGVGMDPLNAVNFASYMGAFAQPRDVDHMEGDFSVEVILEAPEPIPIPLI